MSVVGIGFEIDTKKLEAKLASYPDEIVRNVEAAQKANAFDAQSVSRQMVQSGARSGRTYKRRSITHQASAPGEPPKTDTGYLVSRIRGYVEERIVCVLEAGTRYASMLEFGTSKMGPRPFLQRSAAYMMKQRGTKRLIAAVRKAGKEMAGR